MPVRRKGSAVAADLGGLSGSPHYSLESAQILGACKMFAAEVAYLGLHQRLPGPVADNVLVVKMLAGASWTFEASWYVAD